MVCVIFLLHAFQQISEPGDAEWHNLNDHLRGFTLTTHASIHTAVMNDSFIGNTVTMRMYLLSLNV